MGAERAKAACLVAWVLLAAVSAAQGTIWVNDFGAWTGSDATSVSSYTDVDSMYPNSYAVQVDTTLITPVQGVPWLSQGDVSGNKTARFNNIQDSSNGRARFKTLLPSSMDLAEGISVAWSMRVGAANTGRGPIQIATTASGMGDGTSSDAFNAYVRLHNSGDPSGNSYIDIQRNGGGLYKDLTSISNEMHRVERLVLGSNLADEFHQWTATAVYNADDDKAYWKLWLDGQLLLFDGPSGSPVLAGDQYSFRTFQEGFTGPSYIGLGDLNNQHMWDFEFDYVNYRDDGFSGYWVPEPTSLLLLVVGAGLIRRRRML